MLDDKAMWIGAAASQFYRGKTEVAAALKRVSDDIPPCFVSEEMWFLEECGSDWGLCTGKWICTVTSKNHYLQQPQRATFLWRTDRKSKDYIFGRNYGFLGLSGTDIKTAKSDSRITSVWTVEGIEITQNIELANSSSAENGMVIISYTAKNSAGKKADNVSARIMLDTALGYQDYAYYKIPDNGTYITVENERIVDGSTVGHMMFGYDDENKSKITAYTVNASVGNEECVPVKVAFGHWNNIAATVYDFEPNKDLTFTNPYNAQYLTADSAYALYFDMGALEVGSESTCATNYGVYSNAGVGRDAKLAINISGSNPLTLNADKTAYVSANAGDKEGELTLGASIKNFVSDSSADLKNVKVAVYPDSMMIPIDENGSTINANGEQYGTQALYSVDYNSIAAGQTKANIILR